METTKTNIKYVSSDDMNFLTQIENALYDYVRKSKYPNVAKLGMMFFIAIGFAILTFDYNAYYIGFMGFVLVPFVKFVVYLILGLIAMYIGVAPLMGGHNKMEQYALKIDELFGYYENKIKDLEMQIQNLNKQK
jgi:hypothetical protein